VVCFNKYFFAAAQRARMHPADLGVEDGTGSGKIVKPDNHVAPADVNVVLQQEGDRLRAERLGQRPAVGPDVFDSGDDPARENKNLLAGPDNSAGDLAAETAKVMKGGILRIVGPVDPLNGKTKAVEVPVAADMNALEMAQQGRAGSTTACEWTQKQHCRRPAR